MKRSASFDNGNKKHQVKRRPNTHFDGYVDYCEVDGKASESKTVTLCYEKVGDGTMCILWLETGREEGGDFEPIEKRIKSDSDFRDNLNAHVVGLTRRSRDGVPAGWKVLFMMKPNDAFSEEEFEENRSRSSRPSLT